MHASSPHQSPLSSLSPLSSRTAAEYERENIKRLKLEVRGLTTALNTLKKGSKEWVMLNSKLEIAKDELNCMLEDRSIAMTFGNNKVIKASDLSKGGLSSIPTPPLGGRLDKVNHQNIPTPPVVRQYVRKLTKRNSTGDIDTVVAKYTPVDNNRLSANNVHKDDPKVEKFSLEWFQIRMKEKSAAVPSSSRSSCTERDATLSQQSKVKELADPHNTQQHHDEEGHSCKLNSVQKYSLERFMISNEQKTKEDIINDVHKEVLYSREKSDENVILSEQRRRLDKVPKFSLEWFEIKKEIEASKRKKQQLP